jgi:hypothetical protein
LSSCFAGVNQFGWWTAEIRAVGCSGGSGDEKFIAPDLISGPVFAWNL